MFLFQMWQEGSPRRHQNQKTTTKTRQNTRVWKLPLKVYDARGNFIDRGCLVTISLVKLPIIQTHWKKKGNGRKNKVSTLENSWGITNHGNKSRGFPFLRVEQLLASSSGRGASQRGSLILDFHSFSKWFIEGEKYFEVKILEMKVYTRLM